MVADRPRSSLVVTVANVMSSRSANLIIIIVLEDILSTMGK